MTMTKSLPPSTSMRLLNIAKDLDQATYDLHQDVESMAWAYETLWLQEFSLHGPNERLSHLPISLMRCMTARTEQLRAAVGELFPEREGALLARNAETAEQWIELFGTEVAPENRRRA